MEKFIQVLSVIFYLIWIPLGLVLLAAILFMMMANPFGRMMGSAPGGSPFGPPGGFGQGPSARQDNPPGEFGQGPPMHQDSQPGSFGPPAASVAPR